MNWNTCRKGKGAAGKLGRSFRSLGVDVALLQEVSRLGELRGKIYSGMVIFGDRSSDCGIWIARHLLSAVRNFHWGDYWYAIVLNDIIILNTHILDHNEDEGRAHKAFLEMNQFVWDITSKNPQINFHIVAGGDFNAQLPAGFEDITGDSV